MSPDMEDTTTITRSTLSPRQNNRRIQTCTWALTWGPPACSRRPLRPCPTARMRIPRWRSQPQTWPFRSSTEEPKRVNMEVYKSSAKIQSQNTLARSAAKTTRQVQTCLVTSRLIEVSIPAVQRSATSAARCTSPCPLSPCTSWPTTSITGVTFAARRSRDPGFFRVTSGLTLGRSLTCAPSARSALPTGPTCERTCRLTRLRRTSSVQNVKRLSRSSPTWTSTTSRPVSEDWTPQIRILRSRLQFWAENFSDIFRVRKTKQLSVVRIFL